MRTLTTLRDRLAAAVPELALSPEKMAVYAQAGRIVSKGAASLSFEYAFTAEVIITDFGTDPDAVFVPLLAWVREAQPHILDSPDLAEKAIRFTAELINSETCDISIQVDLVEPVIVLRRPPASPEPTTTAQRWEIIHPAPPERLGEPALPAEIDIVDAANNVLAHWSIPAARN